MTQNQPRGDMVDEPRVDVVDEPRVDVVDEPRVDVVDEPRVDVVYLPRVDVAYEPRVDFPDSLSPPFSPSLKLKWWCALLCHKIDIFGIPEGKCSGFGYCSSLLKLLFRHFNLL